MIEKQWHGDDTKYKTREMAKVNTFCPGWDINVCIKFHTNQSCVYFSQADNMLLIAL